MNDKNDFSRRGLNKMSIMSLAEKRWNKNKVACTIQIVGPHVKYRLMQLQIEDVAYCSDLFLSSFSHFYCAFLHSSYPSFFTFFNLFIIRPFFLHSPTILSIFSFTHIYIYQTPNPLSFPFSYLSSSRSPIIYSSTY